MIDFQNVRFSYDGASFALEGVSLQVAAGEFVCVLGGNGSGKSTLAKHIDALLLPDEGKVVVDGMDTADAACTYLVRKTAGMVFQNPDDQLVASLVEDDVAFGPENLGVPNPELRERVTKSLAAVGLSGFERKETYALSGGQKQRVAIAGVLAMDPKVLVLDEASAMLDPRGRAGLMRVCRELNEHGFTIVMITHFMDEAAQADRVVVMDEGKVACQGTPAEVFAQAQLLASLNLDVPFAMRFSQELAAAGVKVAPTISEGDLAQQVLRLAGAGAAGAPEEAAEPMAFPAELTGDAAASDGAGAGSLGSNPQGTPLIQLENVSYAYDAAAARKARKQGLAVQPQGKTADWGNSPESVWALENVSLTVNEGEFLGIAGHTGSGKSTLIQHMNGILKPTSGRVLVGGNDLSSKRAAADARGFVGVVFQYPEHQLFAETVYKDVAFGPRNLGLSESEIDARVREALESVGLEFDRIAQKSPFELSGGQQRRVAFAGVLAMRPRVLVLDEPAAGLDPASKRSFLDMIDSLHKQGLTVAMVSHNMDDLARMCDRVAVLNQGKLLAVGAPSQLFVCAGALKAVGLGTTSAQRLANRLYRGGLALADVPGAVSGSGSAAGTAGAADAASNRACDLPFFTEEALVAAVAKACA